MRMSYFVTQQGCFKTEWATSVTSLKNNLDDCATTVFIYIFKNQQIVNLNSRQFEDSH